MLATKTTDQENICYSCKIHLTMKLCIMYRDLKAKLKKKTLKAPASVQT
jgi:hypothetical protein